MHVLETGQRKTGGITRNNPGLRLSMALSKELRNKIGGPPKLKNQHDRGKGKGKRPLQSGPTVSVPGYRPTPSAHTYSTGATTNVTTHSTRAYPRVPQHGSNNHTHTHTHTHGHAVTGEGDPGYILASSTLVPDSSDESEREGEGEADDRSSVDGFMATELEPESNKVVRVLPADMVYSRHLSLSLSLFLSLFLSRSLTRSLACLLSLSHREHVLSTTWLLCKYTFLRFFSGACIYECVCAGGEFDSAVTIIHPTPLCPPNVGNTQSVRA